MAVLLAVIVYVPQLVIDPRGLTRDQWLTHVQDLRTTILQGLGGLVVLAGAVVAALNLRLTGRQNRAVQEQNRAVLELQRRGQTTERFSKAIEQLGQQGREKLDIRIGAVYALEQIARDSAELHWPIMEVLTAYLREHAPIRAPAEAVADDSRRKRLPADHQAIATVIGRRRRLQDPGVTAWTCMRRTSLAFAGAGHTWSGHCSASRIWRRRSSAGRTWSGHCSASRNWRRRSSAGRTWSWRTSAGRIWRGRTSSGRT